MQDAPNRWALSLGRDLSVRDRDREFGVCPVTGEYKMQDDNRFSSLPCHPLHMQ
jgi:hypothetical protein